MHSSIPHGTESFLDFRGADSDDIKWSIPLLREFGPLEKQITSTYHKRKKQGRFIGNAWLRDAHELLIRQNPMLRRLQSLDDFDDKAHWCADECAGYTSEAQLDGFALAHGLPAVPGEGAGRILRAQDWQFWRRVIRRLCCQWRDQLMRHLGYVHKRKQIYCCDHVVAWQAQRTNANRDLLEKMIARSNEGDEMTLAEIQEHSLANPANRFAELMVRTRGMEEHATLKGYAALAITLTAPSKYHARHIHGAANTKYNGATPRDTNDYLCGVFKKIRSKLKNRRVEWSGYRVVEAHHDGSPHWHLMLFIRSGDLDLIEETFLKYGLAEDGSEHGAKKHRVQSEDIDQRRGSATGYMTKYIAKNIEGAATNADLFGNEAQAVEARVVAWARTWRIRQFQFFGAPSVTIWREYRRIRKEQSTQVIPPHHIPWADADNSNWTGFTASMGTGRNQRTTLLRDIHIDPQTGECTAPLNRYGEEKELPVVGLLREGIELRTRLKYWEILRKAPPSRLGLVSLTVREDSPNARTTGPP